MQVLYQPGQAGTIMISEAKWRPRDSRREQSRICSFIFSDYALFNEQLIFHLVEVLLVAVVFDLKVEPVEISPRVLGLPFGVALRVDALGTEAVA